MPSLTIYQSRPKRITELEEETILYETSSRVVILSGVRAYTPSRNDEFFPRIPRIRDYDCVKTIEDPIELGPEIIVDHECVNCCTPTPGTPTPTPGTPQPSPTPGGTPTPTTPVPSPTPSPTPPAPTPTPSPEPTPTPGDPKPPTPSPTTTPSPLPPSPTPTPAPEPGGAVCEAVYWNMNVETRKDVDFFEYKCSACETNSQKQACIQNLQDWQSYCECQQQVDPNHPGPPAVWTSTPPFYSKAVHVRTGCFNCCSPNDCSCGYCGGQKEDCGIVCAWGDVGNPMQCDCNDPCGGGGSGGWDPQNPHESCVEYETLICGNSGTTQDAVSAVTLVMPGDVLCKEGKVAQCSDQDCCTVIDDECFYVDFVEPGQGKNCSCHRNCHLCGADCSQDYMDVVVVYACGCNYGGSETIGCFLPPTSPLCGNPLSPACQVPPVNPYGVCQAPATSQCTSLPDQCGGPVQNVGQPPHLKKLDVTQSMGDLCCSCEQCTQNPECNDEPCSSEGCQDG